MTQHLHFRVKVDFSQFFHDARRSCWIFIDQTKIQQIIHIKQHISKLFNIREPFHLLLNEQYLPPTEDVRVLKENETILVVPGSGIVNEAVLSRSTTVSDIDICKSLTEIETINAAIHDKMAQTTDTKTGNKTQIVACDAFHVSNGTQPSSTANNTIDMTFHTIIDDTEADTDSKVTDCSNLAEDCNMTNPVTYHSKRKRVRKRKPRNKSELISPPNMNEENGSKKPRITDSFIISSGKHIRFDDTEAKEPQEKYVYNIARQEHENIEKASREERLLSTLISFRQSSTPITFAKMSKHEAKAENLSEAETSCTKNLNKANSIEQDLCGKETEKETQCYKNLMHTDLEKIPVMTRKPHVGDIIAFKTLKLSADYTPQISKFIIAEVFSVCALSLTYTLKILEGKEEIEVPTGKLSISEEDESSCQYNRITFSISQMREPRLIV